MGDSQSRDMGIIGSANGKMWVIPAETWWKSLGEEKEGAPTEDIERGEIACEEEEEEREYPCHFLKDNSSLFVSLIFVFKARKVLSFF